MSDYVRQSVDLKVRAKTLWDCYGGYNPAAVKLGNSNLRATLWRFLNEDGFKPSEHFLEALRGWSGAEPIIVKAEFGSNIFGDVGLIDFGQVVDVLILSLGEIDDSLLIKCKVCGRQTFKRSGNQLYCRRHSWSTPEGRRWHRQQKKREESDE